MTDNYTEIEKRQLQHESGTVINSSAFVTTGTEDDFLFGKPVPDIDFNKSSHNMLPKPICTMIEHMTGLPANDEALQWYDILYSRIFDITSSFHGQFLDNEKVVEIQNTLDRGIDDLIINSPPNSPAGLFTSNVGQLHLDPEYGAVSIGLDNRLVRLSTFIQAYNTVVREGKEKGVIPTVTFEHECLYPTFMTLNQPQE